MAKRLTIEDFITKATEIHCNRYDYSLVNYKNINTEVKIICPEHGEFRQKPNYHLKGSICPKCAAKNRILKRQLPFNIFLEKANQIHNNFYQYLEESYKGSNKKIKIICPEHGIFEQSSSQHLNGQGCPKCAGNYNYSTESFIKKAKLIHGDRYDYSLVEYINSHKKIKIICPEHGIFEQKPYHHLRGHGCSKCTFSSGYTQEEFILKVKSIHNNLYDYSLVDYKNIKEKIKIICPVHGIFEQKAQSHLLGRGCYQCAQILQTSKGEKEVLEYVKTIYSGLILENNREIINPFELDIFLPELNIAIEYNGEYWHKLREDEKPGYHQLKERLCQKNDITLINVWENDWKNNMDLIKNILNYNIHHKCHPDS